MKPVLCIGLSLLGYCVHRLLVLDGSLPLMFDANEAEYGFYRAVLPYVDTSLDKILWHPHTRGEFLNACRTVGNQMHGSLGVAGVVLLWVLQTQKSWLASTWLLKGLAIFYSGLGLTGWLIGLWRALPKKHINATLISFALLYTFAPPVFVKISLLHWGTHDLSNMAMGLMMAVCLPWITKPADNWNGPIRAVILGVIIGTAPLFNYALVLPIALFIGGWMIERLLFSNWSGRGRTLLIIAGAVMIGIGLMTQILQSGYLFGMGFPKQIPTESFLYLAGKNGQPFLSEATTGFSLAALTEPEAWSDGMQWLPGPAWGTNWSTSEQILKGAMLSFGAALWFYRLWRGKEASQALRLAGQFGIFWVLGWCAITLLCLGYSIDGGAPMGVAPRYYTLLYPIGFACLSCSLGVLKKGGLLLISGLLLIGLQDTTRYVDFGASAKGYDASILYFTDRSEPLPKADRVDLTAKSDSWIFGYGIINRLQYKQYWTYHTASEKYTLPVKALVTQHRQASRNRVENTDEFEDGMRTALQFLYPSTAGSWLETQMARQK